MPASIMTNFRYHPVGQGLFTSSFLSVVGLSQRFTWVFDCGTSSSRHLIDDAMPQVVPTRVISPDKGQLDLVAISHFDEDHVSGLIRLLRRFDIDILLLPYVPLWERMLLAFHEDVGPDDPFLDFFVNPVAYVRANSGEGSIRLILLVPPSGGEDAPAPDEPGPDDKPGEGEWRLDIDKGDPPPELAEDPPVADELIARAQPAVGFLSAGGGLRLRGYWEFLPYNDAAIERKFCPSFRASVEENRDNLLARDADDKSRKQALADLKQAYDDEFGDDPEPRNLISLFLYAGPLGLSPLPALAVTSGLFLRRRLLRFRFRWGGRLKTYWLDGEKGLAQLFTGDGYLHTPERLRRLLTHLKSRRLARLGVLQVMHHGAARNWHLGVANAFAPWVSIFSSDPAHKGYKHPHDPVVQDFARYAPMQVDRTHGAVVHGLFRSR